MPKHARDSDVINITSESYEMKHEDIDRFLEYLKETGKSKETIGKYGRAMEMFYQYLPSDKRIHRDTVTIWKEELLQSGYAVATLNSILSACNLFLRFIGCREFKPEERFRPKKSDPFAPQPELTRTEYLRMLSKAREKRDKRPFLIAQVLACTGIRIYEIPNITVENVQKRHFYIVDHQGVSRMIYIPTVLGENLLAYAERQEILSGEIFLNEKGRPLNRSQITLMVTRLGELAGISHEKANPTCLRRLFAATWEGIRQNMQILMEQTLDRQIEQEQRLLGMND